MLHQGSPSHSSCVPGLKLVAHPEYPQVPCSNPLGVHHSSTKATKKPSEQKHIIKGAAPTPASPSWVWDPRYPSAGQGAEFDPVCVSPHR